MEEQKTKLCQNRESQGCGIVFPVSSFRKNGYRNNQVRYRPTCRQCESKLRKKEKKDKKFAKYYTNVTIVESHHSEPVNQERLYQVVSEFIFDILVVEV